ncbi:MAG TPA: serine hydrolase [Chitinophagales bacterium]|nr:serine hydrolase [Chitinophagales bacterium]
MGRFITLFLLLFAVFAALAQGEEEEQNILTDIFNQQPEQFDSILKNKEDYRLQIIYTQVDRDRKGRPHFTTYSLDTGKYYYYCASMIKLLEIPVAMEKIDGLAEKYGISIYDSMAVSGEPCGDASEAAYRTWSDLNTPAQMIKEMLLVSNNHAFNPLYDFLTQRYFNQRAHELGYNSAIITNRFAACDSFQNRINSAVSFYNRSTGQLKFLQPSSINPNEPKVTDMNTVVGKGFWNGNSLDPPKDFCFNNYISLGDLHRLLIRLIFPGTQTKEDHFKLQSADYDFIHKYMGMYPRECARPVYDTVAFHDVFVKFFVTPTDTGGHAPLNFRVFNKVGQAYGFTTDCSYMADTLNHVEFFLSCSIYTNKDQILNDGAYEYETVALPFMRNLFNAIYARELARPKKHPPQFGQWDFTDTVF